jgi:hypothetical protein
MACTKVFGRAFEKVTPRSRARREANQKRRAQFLEEIHSAPLDEVIFLDESGVTTSMTRLYARCLGGWRIHEAMPGSHWKIMTILGAMSTQGMIATMTIEEATDKERFSIRPSPICSHRSLTTFASLVSLLRISSIPMREMLLKAIHAEPSP